MSAAIGNRGGGKSNGVTVAVEQFLDAGVQVVILDYVGIHFGIRRQADGKTPSKFQIPVMGGRHGDIDLSATAGALVAEALAERRSSAILDMSMMSKGDRCRFATDFAEAFFRSKKSHPGPVHLVLEEAQRFIPQRVQPDQMRMLGAFEEIAEVGRNFGIGMTLVSQRPQKLNKDVLNLADTLLVYRTIGTHERKALAEWVQEKGAEGRADVANELPGLPTGTAIVWCPVRRLYGQFAIQMKTTFDAGATPLQVRAEVHTQPLDLGDLQDRMGKLVEEMKANDPKVMKAEISKLRRELAQKPQGPAAERKVEVPVVPPEWVSEVEEAISRLDHLKEQIFREIAKQVDFSCEQLAQMVQLGARFTPAQVAPFSRPVPPRQQHTPVTHTDGGDVVGNGGLRRMLVALAQRPTGLTNGQLGVRAGLSSKSGTFSNYLSRARQQGWIVDEGQIRRITDAGTAALGRFEPLPEGRALAEHWMRELGGGAGRMLHALVDAYPETLTSAELGARAGISPGSGTFSNYLSRLRTLELMVGRGGQICASDELFDG